MNKNNLMIGSLCALGCEVLYGMSYIFTKQATQSASALSLLGWRFLLAFIVMNVLALMGIIKIRLKGKNLKPLLLVALFSPVIYFIGETFGISSTTASESGVFLACIPVASLITSTLILKKKPSKLQVAGILITLAGVILTVLAVGAASSLSITGYTFLMMAVISYALYCAFVDRAEQYTGAEITYMMLVAGAIVFVILAVAEGLVKGNLDQVAVLPFYNTGFLIAVLYQGIGCSVLAFFLSNVAIAKIGVNRTSSFIGVATVVSIIAGALLLKESFTLWQIVGAVVIIIGVYAANAKMVSV
ncbi:DMT family transporter [Peptostreptococcus equinus]|uniref:DMT family transporter n=1 Tax=Peptostreptococcus equinus TaxID=3003601 RepID=A0ABY7JNN1_9FIRM|nr:DMT family transporter [Peptostreptococcus sp. CBA3647]WAW14071.1 DMT family transporter [Peptostreptococcus sp. CBA3647]